MFTFFAVQTQLQFLTVANYENNLPLNVGLRPDGGLCKLPIFEHFLIVGNLKPNFFY